MNRASSLACVVPLSVLTRPKALNVVLLALVMCVLKGTALAHHSYLATYDYEKTIEIKGEVMIFMYRNPHSVLQVLKHGADGTTQRWACEWAGTLTLDRSGVDRTTLKRGDKVIISGLPGRNPEDHRMLIKTIHRPSDGWKWAGDSQ